MLRDGAPNNRATVYLEVGRASTASEHALEGMVNVISKKCAGDGCFKQPNYGVSGRKNPDGYSTMPPKRMRTTEQMSISESEKIALGACPERTRKDDAVKIEVALDFLLV